MLLYIFTISIILWLTLLIGYNFSAWKIRKNLMKKFASKINLNFTENPKIKKYYKIEGLYKNKNIFIEELLYLYPKESPGLILNNTMTDKEGAEMVLNSLSSLFISRGLLFHNITHKKIIIKVDNKIIYNKDRDFLLPGTSKIQKIIDKYIENGTIPNTNTLNKIGLILLICASLIPLIYIFITFILN
jgi:hypothetical protein